MSTILSNLRWILLGVLLFWLNVIANPLPNHSDPIDDLTLLDPAKIVCTQETIELCQRCAKKTKSTVIYPWCCANHEEAQEWCKDYLYFGLP